MTLSSEDNVQRGPQVKIPMMKVSLEQYIVAKLKENANNVAQVYPELGNKSYTYSDIHRRALLVAKTMTRLGLKKGDVVAAAMLSRPQFTPLLIGCMLKGILLAPVNPKFDKHDRRHVLNILRPRLLITENSEWSDDHPDCPVLSTTDVETWMQDDDGSNINGLSEDLANGQLNGHSNGDVNGNVNGDAESADPLDAPALVLCSSGTGGSPRGVAIRHRALMQLAAIAGASGMMKFEDAAFMMVTPVFWVSAIAIQIVAITAGARMVVLSEFEDEIFLKSLKEHKVIGTLMSPHLGVHLLKKTPQPDLSPLMFIIFAGASMDAKTQVAIQTKFRLKINQMYGMTELLLVLGDDHRKPTPPGSVGKLHIGTEAKVLDTETGKALGPNKPGELCFRGPTVMRGYYNDDKSTAAAIDSEGWFHTGDVGYYDQDGYFYITDRMKDLIKYRGEHVPSSELEALLLKHPAVKDAAVVGVPDPVDTELPRAYISLNRDAQATDKDIINYIESEVADHKRLRGGVVIMDKVPRTGTGKLHKRVIREMIRAELAVN